MNNNYYGYPYQSFNPNMYRTAASGMRSAISLPRSGGLLRSLFGGASAATRGVSSVAGAATTGFSWNGLLNGASRTLGVINQAIPVFNQMRPIWNNTKTMFRVARAINSDDRGFQKTDEEIKEIVNNDNSPTFFI